MECKSDCETCKEILRHMKTNLSVWKEIHVFLELMTKSVNGHMTNNTEAINMMAKTINDMMELFKRASEINAPIQTHAAPSSGGNHHPPQDRQDDNYMYG